jgi:hypothetical protein
MLRYPIPKEKRIQLVRLYYAVCTVPGMPLHVVATCAEQLDALTRSRNKLSVRDVRLSWRPLFDVLYHDLFLTRRQFEVRCVLPAESGSRARALNASRTLRAVKCRTGWARSPIPRNASSIPLQSRTCCPHLCP